MPVSITSFGGSVKSFITGSYRRPPPPRGYRRPTQSIPTHPTYATTTTVRSSIPRRRKSQPTENPAKSMARDILGIVKGRGFLVQLPAELVRSWREAEARKKEEAEHQIASDEANRRRRIEDEEEEYKYKTEMRRKAKESRVRQDIDAFEHNLRARENQAKRDHELKLQAMKLGHRSRSRGSDSGYDTDHHRRPPGGGVPGYAAPFGMPYFGIPYPGIPSYGVPVPVAPVYPQMQGMAPPGYPHPYAQHPRGPQEEDFRGRSTSRSSARSATLSRAPSIATSSSRSSSRNPQARSQSVLRAVVAGEEIFYTVEGDGSLKRVEVERVGKSSRSVSPAILPNNGASRRASPAPFFSSSSNRNTSPAASSSSGFYRSGSQPALLTSGTIRRGFQAASSDKGGYEGGDEKSPSRGRRRYIS